jgi:hypothetical protein
VLEIVIMNKNEKKPYTPPQLIEYGDLAEITRTNAADENDGVAGSQSTG